MIKKLMPIFLLSACASQLPVTPTVADTASKRVEDRELPPHPNSENIPDDIPKGDWAEPIEAGECKDRTNCPEKNGILISEEKAYKINILKIRYDEIRSMYESDRQVWKVHRELYEERLKLANGVIHNLQPSWWDKNKLQFGVVGGIIAGMAASVAIIAVTDSK